MSRRPLAPYTYFLEFLPYYLPVLSFQLCWPPYWPLHTPGRLLLYDHCACYSFTWNVHLTDIYMACSLPPLGLYSNVPFHWQPPAPDIYTLSPFLALFFLNYNLHMIHNHIYFPSFWSSWFTVCHSPLGSKSHESRNSLLNYQHLE